MNRLSKVGVVAMVHRSVAYKAASRPNILPSAQVSATEHYNQKRVNVLAERIQDRARFLNRHMQDPALKGKKWQREMLQYASQVAARGGDPVKALTDKLNNIEADIVRLTPGGRAYHRGYRN